MRDQLTEVWRQRPRLIVGSALGAVALVTPGAFSLGGGSAPAVAGSAPGLNIAVVAPVEPDIQPGERMEVGTLVDGFDATALAHARSAQTGPINDHPAASDRDEDAHNASWRPAAARQDKPYGDHHGHEQATAYRQNREDRDGREGRDSGWRMVERRGDRMGLGFDGSRPETGAERQARFAAYSERRRPYRDMRRDEARPYASGLSNGADY